MSLRSRIRRERGRLQRLRKNIEGRQRGLRAVNRDIAALKRKRDSLPNPSFARHSTRLEIEHLRKVRREIVRLRDRHKRKANIIARRLRHDRQVYKRNKAGKKVPVHGLVWFDGKQAAAWIAQILGEARAAGVRGYLVSGFRTRAYSQSLCYRMCGRPACPGRCAGVNTNHVGIEYPGGAADWSDPWSLEQYLQHHATRLHGYRLPADRPHFSATGN